MIDVFYQEEDWSWYGYECKGCGWWWNFELSDDWTAARPTIHVGLLHRTQEPSPELVAGIETINANISSLYQMNPTKFEQFVGGILKDFYDCEVLHVGKSNDGGVDLILLDSNKGKVPIQVKRRTRKSKTEPSSIVREFRGALLLQGCNSGMIVTTADHFSKEAVEASKPKSHHPVQQDIELIDVRRLFDIMGLVGKRGVAAGDIKLRFNISPNKSSLDKILSAINR